MQKLTLTLQAFFLKNKVHLFSFLVLGTLAIFCILASSHLWHGDVLIHTDIARDLLVMKDIVATKKITLIGPRAGGISGVFHGPLWYYISLPAFILTSGNPIGMGWFWWTFGMVFLAAFFLLSKKVTKNLTTASIATLLLATNILHDLAGLYNPFGAIVVSVFFFYSFYLFLQRKTFLFASLAWFLGGCAIQFQMGFGAPLVALMLPVFFYTIIKSKKYFLVTSLIFLAIPLSTFFLFDLRHDFLQTKAVLSYLTQPSDEKRVLTTFLLKRLTGMAFLGWNVLANWHYLILPIMVLCSYINIKKSSDIAKNFTYYFLYIYVGYWIITLAFAGDIMGYYYRPFIPISVLFLAMSARYSGIGRMILLITCVLNIFFYIPNASYRDGDFNSSSWKLFSTIYADTKNQYSEFGYFIYSQDQYAYPLKYAFLYLGRNSADKELYFKKSPVTVLVKAEDNPENPFSTAPDWQKNKVRITAVPISTKAYPYGYTWEMYSLNETEVAAPIDPNLITDLTLR